MTEAEMTALDLAVAEAMGYRPTHNLDGWFVVDGIAREYSPSRSWSDAGPLVERHNVSVYPIDNAMSGDRWSAFIKHGGPPKRGLTPLIAICRAVIAAKAGVKP